MVAGMYGSEAGEARLSWLFEEYDVLGLLR